jgi:hypothetical protein
VSRRPRSPAPLPTPRERRPLWLGAALLLLLGLPRAAQAQESVRMSLASAAAAEDRQKAASSFGYYNLKLGPTAWSFSATLGVDYNDNVNYTETNPEGDIIFRPQINARSMWPVSDQNSINFSLGAGYSAYMQHTDLSQFFITPNSGLSFDMYVGDFWINLHDRFSLTEDTYQDPSVAGSGGYSQFQNVIGVAPLWDLNKIQLRSGYDHLNYISMSSNPSYPDGQADVFSLSGGYAVRSGTYLGAEMGWQTMRYSGGTTVYPEANQWNVGCFYDTQASEYIHLTAHAGYTVYTPQGGQALNTATNLDGVYAQIQLKHRVNQKLEYTLMGGRSITFALYGGTTDLYSAILDARWRLLRKIIVGLGFTYYHGTQLLVGGETYDQYGPRISLSRPITAKLTGGLSYQYYWRTSNEANRSYNVGVVGLDLNFKF